MVTTRIIRTLTSVLLLLALACATAHAQQNDLRVLLFGDSITQGFARDASGNWWGVGTSPKGQRITWWGYGMHLERMINSHMKRNGFAYNWGYGGLNSNQALACGSNWDCIDNVLGSRNADMIMIMLGANDLYAGISHTTTSHNLSVMIDKSLESGIKPVLGTITPNTRIPEHGRRILYSYNPLLRELSQSKQVLLADHHAAMHSQWDQLYSSGDGLHLNDRGNLKLAERWFNSFKDDLGRVKTEIGVINLFESTLSGMFRGYDGSGVEVWSLPVELPGYGRMEYDVSSVAGEASPMMDSMRLDIFEGQAVGYQKFHQAESCRVAFEALPRPNEESLFIPHIASNNEWWTGIAWTNTTDVSKTLHITLDNGQEVTRHVGVAGHEAFTIASIFETKQPDAGAAWVEEGRGMAGLMFFGRERGNVLSGVTLSDAVSQNLHFPHVAQDQEWWTGLVVFNPGPEAADLTLVYRDAFGAVLGRGQAQVGPGRRLVGTPPDLGFPDETAWFSVFASRPVTGFELFGTTDNNQLAGYPVVDLAAATGVFPKLERDGWTGIAFVNIGRLTARLTLEARNDMGEVVAVQNMMVRPNHKSVAVAEDLFPGQSIADATYIRFVSSEPIIGFQLNGSGDKTMLDGISALGSEAHIGAQNLYYPRIVAE